MTVMIVVPDACVLVPATIRDTIFLASLADMYQIRLTNDILEEVQRHLPMPEANAVKTITDIKTAFEGCIITNHKRRIRWMPINVKDRHVLAAAVAGKAQIIVTRNLKDFPDRLLSRYKIKAMSPDDFFVYLYHQDKEAITQVLLKQANRLHKPARTVMEVLNNLQTPQFADLMRPQFVTSWTQPKPIEVRANLDAS